MCSEEDDELLKAISNNDKEIYEHCIKTENLDAYCFDTNLLSITQNLKIKDCIKVKKRRGERELTIVDVRNKESIKDIRLENERSENFNEKEFVSYDMRNIKNKWWINHPSDNNPLKVSKLKSKKEWQGIKPYLFMITPGEGGNEFQINEKYGDIEIFESRSRIPDFYKDAPPGQCVFQSKKAINLFSKNESFRSKSKSRYESRITKLKHEHFNPKISDIIEEPIPYHSFCVICKCAFESYYCNLICLVFMYN